MIRAKNFIGNLIDQWLQKWSNCKILSWDSLKPQKETFQERIFKSAQRFLFWMILTLWPKSCPVVSSLTDINFGPCLTNHQPRSNCSKDGINLVLKMILAHLWRIFPCRVVLVQELDCLIEFPYVEVKLGHSKGLQVPLLFKESQGWITTYR